MGRLLIGLGALCSVEAQAGAALVQWRPVASGVEYAQVKVVKKPLVGDGTFHLVRIAPEAHVVALAASAESSAAKTAAQWARDRRLALVFNAGMYEPDESTHTGRFSVGSHVNSEAWVEKYKSVLVGRGGGQTQMVDTDAETGDTTSAKFDERGADFVAQNLRLIRRPGVNVWAQSKRSWSEVALAATRDGSQIVIYTRVPLTMHDFNERLLGLGLSIEAAMHLEGGPEASLSVHGGGIDVDLSGSYETGFVENDSNDHQWALPNVFGVSDK